MNVLRIITDTETTGLTPAKHDIASIAALNYARPTEVFYIETRIREDRIVEDKALETNGFSREQLKDPNKPSVEEGVRSFFDFSKKQADAYGSQTTLEIGGENPGFDIGFVRSVSDPIGLKWIFGHRASDLHSVVQGKLETWNPRYRESGVVGVVVNTDVAIQFSGLELRKGAHTALEDVRLEAEAFSRILRGKKMLTEYEAKPLPEYLDLQRSPKEREKGVVEFCNAVEVRELAAANKK